MNLRKKKRDSGFLLLLISFCLISIIVFVFAISQHHKKKIEAIGPNPVEQHKDNTRGFSVTRVIDGDTIEIIGADRIKITIRLAGIDAPELDQPFGYQSKMAIERKLDHKTIDIEVLKKGKYGRYIANVIIDNQLLNRNLVEEGYAWVDIDEEQNGEMLNAQVNAKAKKIGLWQNENPIPPWEWRKKKE